MASAALPVVILCGGEGMRLRGATDGPKALAPVGGEPILLHVMRMFADYGHTNFFLALGRQGEAIKDFFLSFNARRSGFSLTLGDQTSTSYLDEIPERGWQVTCVDTGSKAGTAARLLALEPHLPEGSVLASYCDAVSDIDLHALVGEHAARGRLATMATVKVPDAYGVVVSRDGIVRSFAEKPIYARRINAGFFVLERDALQKYIDAEDESQMFEGRPLERLVGDGEVAEYRHGGMWQSMDTAKEQALLDAICAAGTPPWRSTARPAP